MVEALAAEEKCFRPEEQILRRVRFSAGREHLSTEDHRALSEGVGRHRGCRAVGQAYGVPLIETVRVTELIAASSAADGPRTRAVHDPGKVLTDSQSPSPSAGTSCRNSEYSAERSQRWRACRGGRGGSRWLGRRRAQAGDTTRSGRGAPHPLAAPIAVESGHGDDVDDHPRGQRTRHQGQRRDARAPHRPINRRTSSSRL